MKFSQIVKGTRATRDVDFTIWGATARCAVRPMTGLEEGDAMAAGRAYAVSKGIADPKPTDRVYEIGVMVHTLAVACIDPDNHDALYFSSAGEILENLDTDRIAYLYEAQQLFQDECSSRVSKMGEAEWVATVLEVAEAAISDNPLARWPLTTQRDFQRILASRYIGLLMHKSSSGSDSATTTKPSETRSEA